VTTATETNSEARAYPQIKWGRVADIIFALIIAACLTPLVNAFI
jgi:hypothetical protein